MARLKALAAIKGIGYQPLMRQFVADESLTRKRNARAS